MNIETEALPSRKGGQLKELMEIAEDFDAPLPSEYHEKFYEKSDALH